MAITYHGSTSTPADNGTNTATTTAVAPPASMVAGDLVVLIGYQRGNSTTASISADGGQTWNTGDTETGLVTNVSAFMFWCRYNGTWGANPSILFSAGTNTNVVMHVFRPTTGTNEWAMDTASGNISWWSNTAPSSPFTMTAGAYNNTTQASTVSLSVFITADDNTYNTYANGTAVSFGGTSYVRNTSGNDMSSTGIYVIKTTTGAVGSPSVNQATLGGDANVYTAMTWYEFTPAAPRTPRPTSVGHPFIF